MSRCELKLLPHLPPLIPNAQPKNFVSHFGETIPYACNPGYRGVVSAFCGHDGKYKTSGVCLIIGCGVSPPSVPYSVLVNYTYVPLRDHSHGATGNKMVQVAIENGTMTHAEAHYA